MKIMPSDPITSWQIDGKTIEAVTDFIFLCSKITMDGDCSHEIKKMFAPWKKNNDKHRKHIKKWRHHFTNKGPYSQSYGFSSSHIWTAVTSLVAQTVKVSAYSAGDPGFLSLGWEDPLEKEMTTHSSTLAWKIPWMEEPGRLQSMGSQSWTRLSDFTFTFTC